MTLANIHFWFNPLCLAALYYANPYLFHFNLKEMSFLIYAHFF